MRGRAPRWERAMVREIVLGLVFMLTVFGSEARTGVELNERTSVSTPAAKPTSAPQQDSSRLSGVGKVAGLGEFKVALLWDNRVKVALSASDLGIDRITSDSSETEITVSRKVEDTVTIQFGWADGLGATKGDRLIQSIL